MDDRANLLTALRNWLSQDLFGEEYGERYLIAWRQASRRFDVAAATRALDAWGARQLASLVQPVRVDAPHLLPLPEARDPITGFRRGHRAAPLSVNTAPEEMLRQIPGIGASSARKIVASRAGEGPFQSLEQLVERDCLSASGLELGRGYLATSHAPASGLLRTRVADFATYVRVLHALRGTEGGDLAHLTVEEFERGWHEIHANHYWPSSRTLRDSAAASLEAAVLWIEKFRAGHQAGPVATLDSSRYFKLLQRLCPRATARIWIQAPSLNVLHLPTLRPLLQMLATAVTGKVDVRVLYDGGYTPAAIESDDIAYLRARGVSCRSHTSVARMHSRVVLVDQAHVICGSHSWSATSAYHSEELAIYACSEPLAERQAQRFEGLWRAAGSGGAK